MSSECLFGVFVNVIKLMLHYIQIGDINIIAQLISRRNKTQRKPRQGL